jgi:hypothetical protein
MLVLTLEGSAKRSGSVPPAVSRDMNRLTAASAHEWVLAHPAHPELSAIAEWAREAPRRTLRGNAFGEETTIEPRPPLSRAVRPE